MDFSENNARIPAFDEAAAMRAKARWDAVAKPLGSLGLLEDALIAIAGVTGSERIALKRRDLIVMCADNGVVDEGVAQTPREVTLIMARAIAEGRSSVCRMAQTVNLNVHPVDIGMAARVSGTIDRHVANGTENFLLRPAMTREQAAQAVQVGFDMACSLAEAGCDLLVTGEMGIGNTSTSAAVSAALLGLSPRELTGRGAGLDDEKLLHKIEVLERATALHMPNGADALDVLSKLGGYDIAGMAGVFIGGAACRVPVLIDGVVSATAALVAARLCPHCQDAMLASHESAEPAARRILAALGKRAILHADMRLGEGTGAACALPILDLALAVYDNALTYADIGVAAGTGQGSKTR